MVNEPTKTPSDDPIARAAARLGVTRALSRAPAAARTAIERAMRPLASVPSGALTEPAGAFDPSAPSDLP